MRDMRNNSSLLNYSIGGGFSGLVYIARAGQSYKPETGAAGFG